MAVGRPIVACLNGEGARLVCEANAGIAVTAQDAQGLANAILMLYAMSEEERTTLGANAQNYFKIHFDHLQLTDRLIEHLHSQSHLKKGYP
jgi:glycosyltransferase involved in cell wall biosynthesis